MIVSFNYFNSIKYNHEKGFSMKFSKIIIIASILLVPTLLFAEDSNNLVSFESHNLTITLTSDQTPFIFDEGEIEIDSGYCSFKLNKTARVLGFNVNNINNGHIDYNITISEDSSYSLIHFSSQEAGTFPFAISYQATFNDDVENARFSNENVGREVAGTILEKGAYLSPSSYFYPQGKEEASSFSVTAKIPHSWESVADGNKMSESQNKLYKIQKWENPYKSDGLMFMAAPYVIKDTTVNDINIACYFFAEDTSLFESYLSATVGYIEMYSEMIGPYPYNSFIVAENFFPTGYGMPGWTLLGQQIIRLPFIKYTSLGHEVLHNWWGNSVYVDYERGNWCESATVYGADYRYKLMRSESSAMAYRKDILKQYVSYVNDGNDFPIREFTSRTSKNTRTIGYNKAMMVYHMIEEEIGYDAFWQAWKDIYAEYITKKISWEEWLLAFEKTSGKDLMHIIPQWIDQTGAPVLSISDIFVTNDAGSKRVTFKLSETSGGKYKLQVPVRFSGVDTKFDTTVTLYNNEQIYQLIAPATADKIEIDPEFHLFRKLYPEEVEPIVSAVLGFENQVYTMENLESAGTDAYRQFAQNMNGEEQTITFTRELQDGNDTTSMVVLNPSTIPDYVASMIAMTDDSITVNGETSPREGHTFVLTGDNYMGYKKYLTVITSDFESLQRLGQLIPHYGKYSYLVFKGSKNVAKGQWDVKSSPLKVKL